MALSDLSQTEPEAARKGPPCAVCHALATIPPAEAAGLRALMANPAWRYTEISAKIAADPDTPLDIHHTRLARHAKGDCAAREKLR